MIGVRNCSRATRLVCWNCRARATSTNGPMSHGQTVPDDTHRRVAEHRPSNARYPVSPKRASAARAASKAFPRRAPQSRSARASSSNGNGKPPTERFDSGERRRPLRPRAGSHQSRHRDSQRSYSKTCRGRISGRASKNDFHFGSNWLAILSALSQSACTRPVLPARGVTTHSPTFASIQVSCTPRSPALSSHPHPCGCRNACLWSSRREWRGWHPETRACPSRSPRCCHWWLRLRSKSWTAMTYQSDASTELYSGFAP